MCTAFYIAPTYFGAITHHLQGADTKNLFKMYSNKIGHNKHTYVVASTAQDFTGFG